MKDRALYILLPVMLLVSSCQAGNDQWNAFVVSVLFGIVGMAAFVIWAMTTGGKSRRRKKDAIELAVSERAGFLESKVFKKKGAYYLSTDEGHRKVFYTNGDVTVLCGYGDIAAVQIIEDGRLTSSSGSLVRALGGSVIGEAVTGSGGGALAGAAMGALSGVTKQSTLNVHILLRDQAVSAIDICCYNNYGVRQPESVTYFEYKDGKALAQDIYDTFRLIIDKVEREQKKRAARGQESSPEEAAVRQLREISELHEQGKLTDEEFSAMKRKIIGTDKP